MTLNDAKQYITSIMDILPSQKLQSLIDFVTFLKQQPPAQESALAPDEELDEWDREVVAAEEYWFSLPAAARQDFAGKTMAVARGRILDADGDVDALTGRIDAQYPDLPVLYIEAGAEYLLPLVVLSPHFG